MAFEPGKLLDELERLCLESDEFAQVMQWVPNKAGIPVGGYPLLVLNPTATYYRRSKTRLNTLVSTVDIWAAVTLKQYAESPVKEFDRLREWVENRAKLAASNLGNGNVTARVLLSRFAVNSSDNGHPRESILLRWIENYDGVDTPPIDTGPNQ